MPHTLQNDTISLKLMLAGEHYRGTRFDWSGGIVSLQFEGIELAGIEDPDRKNEAGIGRGFYNEFGIESPVGFEETAIGDYFHKIGVGLLKKDERPYSFAHNYEFKPCQFSIQKDAQSLSCECKSEEANGYAYSFKKKISLVENGFCIDYQLENRGRKTIITDEYNHNFISINQETLSESHFLKFPFSLRPGKVGEAINPSGTVLIEDQQVSFQAKPEEVFFFSYLSAEESVAALWRLEDHKTGISMQEKGDFLTNKVNLWGSSSVISPELFYAIHLAAGESCSWSRLYEINRL